VGTNGVTDEFPGHFKQESPLAGGGMEELTNTSSGPKEGNKKHQQKTVSEGTTSVGLGGRHRRAPKTHGRGSADHTAGHRYRDPEERQPATTTPEPGNRVGQLRLKV